MYLHKVAIEGVRSIHRFEMHFPDAPAGWHVLIGDNGSGKSSIVRAISLALIGPYDGQALRLPLKKWIRKGMSSAQISLTVSADEVLDRGANNAKAPSGCFGVSIEIKSDTRAGTDIGRMEAVGGEKNPHPIWHGSRGWFSTAFGPFRRFTGGSKDRDDVYGANPRAAAHLSAFGEDVALTESLEWLSKMKVAELEDLGNSNGQLDMLIRFLNESGLLPQGVKVNEINSKGVFFVDGNGCEVEVTELSDGFRSLLSMAFELIRQMIATYGEERVFEKIRHGTMTIDVPGVVLIDEVDAHLHPTWQTRIGQWFTKVFPAIQFIVTTHSPLICRAAEKGSIWHLPPPGSDQPATEITGLDRERLIRGNILDAYGTEVFGESPVRGAKSAEALEKLGRLNILDALGKITPEEQKQRRELQKILATDAATGF